MEKEREMERGRRKGKEREAGSKQSFYTLRGVSPTYLAGEKGPRMCEIQELLTGTRVGAGFQGEC